MKGVLLSVVIGGVLLASCGRKPPPDRQAWFIESYDNGRIVVRHGGNTYTAVCSEARSHSSDYHDMTTSPVCGGVVEIVGHEVQPFAGTLKKNTDGQIVVMLNVGSRLVLRTVRPDGSLKDEEFTITSVVQARR